MTHFRQALRSLALSGAGAVSGISPGVHVLAGHYMGRDVINSEDVFRRLLFQLSRCARLINIETACDLIKKRELVDEPLIAFTFDDGFSECHSHIAPALESYHVNAAFFVNPGFVKGSDAYVKKFTESVVKVPGKSPMRIAQIKDLADRGFVIGAHTVDHVDLAVIKESDIHHQVVYCRTLVEDMTGKPCDWFAWTFGGYKHISQAALQAAIDNYSLVFSSDRYCFYSSNQGRVINRRHFEPDWPFTHVKYFLSKQRHYPE